MSVADIRTLTPVLIVAGAALLVLLVDLFVRGEGRRGTAQVLSLLGLLAAMTAMFIDAPSAGNEFGFAGAVRADRLASFADMLLLAAATLVILFSGDYLTGLRIAIGEYYGLILLATSGMMLLCASNDLITMFLSVELMSLSIYVLTGITRGSVRSNEASVKYFVLGAFASGVLLYGMAFLYGATGKIAIDQMDLAANAVYLYLGIGLMVAGFAFKIGAAPFHLWVPDVYEGAPTAVTAFMSVTVKTAGFVALMRIVLEVGGAETETLLWGIAALTMIVGNLCAVVQTSVKRMLAYSSVAHTGYALMGLVVMTGPALSASLFYLMAYLFMTLGAFMLVAGAGRGRGVEAEHYDDYTGLAWRRPWTAAAMGLFMLSLAGIPPTAGFMGKFGLFKAAIEERYYWLVLIAIITTVISLGYYLRVIVMMYMKPSERHRLAAPEPPLEIETTTAVLIAAGFTILFGLAPETYLEVVRASIARLL